MKKLFSIVLLLVFCWSPAAFAGDGTPTGDAGWDSAVSKLNDAAQGESPQFAPKMDRRYGFPESTAEGLIDKHGLTFGDACIAMKLAVLSNHSLDQVMGAYEFHRERGWGAVAQSLGIAPGSREFHELKNDSRAFLAETKKSDKKVVHHKNVYAHDGDTAKGKGKNKDTKNKDQEKSKGQEKPEDKDNGKKADTTKPGKGNKK